VRPSRADHPIVHLKGETEHVKRSKYLRDLSNARTGKRPVAFEVRLLMLMADGRCVRANCRLTAIVPDVHLIARPNGSSEDKSFIHGVRK